MSLVVSVFSFQRNHIDLYHANDETEGSNLVVIN